PPPRPPPPPPRVRRRPPPPATRGRGPPRRRRPTPASGGAGAPRRTNAGRSARRRQRWRCSLADQLEPVEGIGVQRDEVGQLADAGEADATEHLRRLVTVPT